MFEGIKFIVGLIVMIVGIVGAAIWASQTLLNHTCTTYAEVTGYETKHISFTGCFVKREGTWLLYNEYKHVKLEGVQ